MGGSDCNRFNAATPLCVGSLQGFSRVDLGWSVLSLRFCAHPPQQSHQRTPCVMRSLDVCDACTSATTPTSVCTGLHGFLRKPVRRPTLRTRRHFEQRKPISQGTRKCLDLRSFSTNDDFLAAGFVRRKTCGSVRAQCKLIATRRHCTDRNEFESS